MLLVTGGEDTVILDSTEIFDSSVGSWRTGAALPIPMQDMRATNLDNRVLIFGIDIFGSDRSSRNANVC